MQKGILSIIVLTLFGLASAEVNSGGACPNVPGQRDFDLSQYMGTFYEYAKYPVAFEDNGKCVTVSRTQISKTEIRRMRTSVDPTTNKNSTVTGTAKLISNGKFQAIYKNAATHPSFYWVLSTDYANYAITYTCQPADDNSHNTYVWIFTRERSPSAATIAKAKNVLSSNGISLTPLTVTDQSNC